MIIIRPAKSFLSIIVLLSVLSGCVLDEDKSKSPFQVVIISDVHVRIPGNPDDQLYDNQGNLENAGIAIDIINRNYSFADFAVVTGDLVGCLFSEDPGDYRPGADNPAERFKQIFDRLLLPYHITLGNHDYHIDFDTSLNEHVTTSTIIDVESVWKKVLGVAPYYAFIHKGVQMIFLNSCRGWTISEPCPGFEVETLCRGSFDPVQMNWLESRLKRREPSVLFSHHPPVKKGESVESVVFNNFAIEPEDRFYTIADQYKDKILAMFAGHLHIWRTYTLFDTINVYGTPSVGDFLGAGSNIALVTIDPAFYSVKVDVHSRP